MSTVLQANTTDTVTTPQRKGKGKFIQGIVDKDYKTVNGSYTLVHFVKCEGTNEEFVLDLKEIPADIRGLISGGVEVKIPYTQDEGTKLLELGQLKILTKNLRRQH